MDQLMRPATMATRLTTRLPGGGGVFLHAIKTEELHVNVVEVFLRAMALPFEHFHKRGYVPHVRDGRFFDGHGLAFGAAVVHAFLIILLQNSTSCPLSPPGKQVPSAELDMTRLPLKDLGPRGQPAGRRLIVAAHRRLQQKRHE
jgi:hypothetical protein